MIRKTLLVLVLTIAVVAAYAVGEAGAGDKKCPKTKVEKTGEASEAGKCAKTAAKAAAPGCAATCAVKCADAPDTPKCKAKKTTACKAAKKYAKKSACACKGKCSGKCACKCAGKCSGKCACACCSRSAYTSHAKAVAEVADEIPYRETKRLVLTGNVFCGGCKMEGISKCQPMIKTDDGKIYPLARGAMVKKMGGCRGGETTYEIKGRVKKIYGVKYIDVKSYATL